MDRLRRIYQLHQILKAHRHPVALNALHEKLESSRASVIRIILVAPALRGGRGLKLGYNVCMKILALDTSTELCSVALWLDGETRMREDLAGQRHSEMVLSMVQELLAEAGLNLNALDGISFGEGPGSFTGLRIGCGVAQGLAFGADLPVAGICTLMALAEKSGASRVIACLDARMGEIYHAIYEKVDGGWGVTSAPGLGLPQDAPDVAGEQWTGCGNGFAAYGEVLCARYAGQLEAVMPEMLPHALEIAKLGAMQFKRGLGRDAAEAAPLYIRNKVALKTSER